VIESANTKLNHALYKIFEKMSVELFILDVVVPLISHQGLLHLNSSTTTTTTCLVIMKVHRMMNDDGMDRLDSIDYITPLAH
jgi:hypothetical protein